MSNPQKANTLSELFSAHPIRLNTRDKCAGPILIGHRGSSLEYPENTVPALGHALKQGAKIVELDVRLSKDEQVVVIHDPKVDRTMHGTGLVSSLTLAELKAMPLKFPAGKTGKPADSSHAPLTIATLEEVFQAFPEAIIAVEIKDNSLLLCSKVVDLIRRYNRIDRTLMVLISLQAKYAKALRKLEPRLVTGHSRAETIRFTALAKLQASRLFKARGATFEVPLKRGRFKVVTKAFIRAAHKKGVRVFVWTINDPCTIARLCQMGVDGIFTDDVATARSVVEQLQSFGK